MGVFFVTFCQFGFLCMLMFACMYFFSVVYFLSLCLMHTNAAYVYFSDRPKHPVKFHVWARISYRGPTAICTFKGILRTDSSIGRIAIAGCESETDMNPIKCLWHELLTLDMHEQVTVLAVSVYVSVCVCLSVCLSVTTLAVAWPNSTLKLRYD